MTRLRRLARVVAVLGGLSVCPPVALARAPQTARERYEAARSREAEVRDQVDRVRTTAEADVVDRMVRTVRRVVLQYESLVRRFPTSGYSDNALFQAGSLSQWLHARYGDERDRAAANKYFAWLEREYPTSPLRRDSRTALQTLSTPAPRAVRSPPAAVAPTPSRAATSAPSSASTPTPAPTPVPSPSIDRQAATLQAIDRAVVDGRVRVTLTLDREAPFTHDLLATPPRAFVDLAGTAPADSLREATLRYDNDAVRQVRVGRRADAVRVVMDLAEPAAVSVFTLYNPFRVVIDAEPTTARALSSASAARPPGGLAPAAPPALPPVTVVVPSSESLLAVSTTTTTTATAPTASAAPTDVERGVDAGPARVEARTLDGPAPAGAAPGVPSANADGSYSLARQLGLGVSRIVIDPGHGGHDPGTLTSGSTEATLVLDVALRLEKLLEKDGFDVVLTRRTDVFIPLEERTAIANREGADLFLSIHANSGRDPAARGVEVYYLSFASNPDAEAVAARENATAAGAMHNLPSIVRAIALNNKLDESRDFAQLVQRSLAVRLSKVNQGLRNRGVKKAPFVVLIGANMPSVLAEIGFITNRQEAALIKTPAYRQRIAESLQAAVAQYQRALKRQGTIAAR